MQNKKYYSIVRGSTEFYQKLVIEICENGKRLLEYGCGNGNSALYFARNNINVSAIDISKEGIKKAKNKAIREGIKCAFYVMDAEKLLFETDTFDVVAGGAILHHLDIVRAYGELARVLKVGGHAIFIEPLGHNLLINLFRKFTPSRRTETERPLRFKDIDLARKFFKKVDTEFFHILTFAAIPFRNLPFFDKLVDFLFFCDKVLVRMFPFLKKCSWIVIIHMKDPIK